MRSPTGRQQAPEGAQHRHPDGHEGVRNEKALETPVRRRDLSSTHMHQWAAQSPDRGCDRRLRRKGFLLDILETSAATPYSPRMWVGRVVISVSKGRILTTVISSNTRPDRPGHAELSSMAKRLNCSAHLPRRGEHISSTKRWICVSQKVFWRLLGTSLTSELSTRSQGQRVGRRRDDDGGRRGRRLCEWWLWWGDQRHIGPARTPRMSPHARHHPLLGCARHVTHREPKVHLETLS